MPSRTSMPPRTVRLSLSNFSRPFQYSLSPRVSPRFLSTSSILCSGSPLFNLNGLANSRETQHFSRERRIPRTEFSPQLQLLRASEVDPFAPAPGASADAIARAKVRDRRSSKDADDLENNSLWQAADGGVISAGTEKQRDAVMSGILHIRAALEGEINALRRQIEQMEKQMEQNRKYGEKELLRLMVLVVAVGLMAMYKGQLLGYLDSVKSQLVQETGEILSMVSRLPSAERQTKTADPEIEDRQPTTRMVSSELGVHPIPWSSHSRDVCIPTSSVAEHTDVGASWTKQAVEHQRTRARNATNESGRTQSSTITRKEELGTTTSLNSWLSRFFWASSR